MKIRRARIDDADPISRLLIDLSRCYVVPDLSEAGGKYCLDELATEKMRERMRSGFAFHVAECDEELAGVVAMSSSTRPFSGKAWPGSCCKRRLATGERPAVRLH